MHLFGRGRLWLVAAACICVLAACGPAAKTIGQRIDEAAAAIARLTGQSATDVKSTLRLTINHSTEEGFATALEGIAAKPTYANRIWSFTEKTVALARSDEVKFVSGLICDGLDAWDDGKALRESDFYKLARAELPSNTDDSVANRLARAAYDTLSSEDPNDKAFVAFLHLTTCVNDKAG